MTGALARQVGGSHYKNMPIQPVEFVLVNNLRTAQANITKYTCPKHITAHDLKKKAGTGV